jgi:hypothetical protein
MSNQVIEILDDEIVPVPMENKIDNNLLAEIFFKFVRLSNLLYF